VDVLYCGKVTIHWLNWTAARLQYSGCSVLRPSYNIVAVLYCGKVTVHSLYCTAARLQ